MTGRSGWIKMWRKTLNNPTIMKDAEYFAVWHYLLYVVVSENTEADFRGKRITLHPGQITLGRKQISDDLHISESKVQRVLDRFESEQQIEQQKSNKCRLITVVGWDGYQKSKQQNEQQLNNKRTTTEQQLNTNKEYKKNKEEKEEGGSVSGVQTPSPPASREKSIYERMQE